MTIVQVDHVTFGYGVDLLFEDVSFTLAAGERLALVAPNGQGKSSLMRIIAGELQPDEAPPLLDTAATRTRLALGINVQRMDWRTTFAVAATAELDLVRLDTLVDRVRMEGEVVAPDPAQRAAERQQDELRARLDPLLGRSMLGFMKWPWRPPMRAARSAGEPVRCTSCTRAGPSVPRRTAR